MFQEISNNFIPTDPKAAHNVCELITGPKCSKNIYKYKYPNQEQVLEWK